MWGVAHLCCTYRFEYCLQQTVVNRGTCKESRADGVQTQEVGTSNTYTSYASAKELAHRKDAENKIKMSSRSERGHTRQICTRLRTMAGDVHKTNTSDFLSKKCLSGETC